MLFPLFAVLLRFAALAPLALFVLVFPDKLKKDGATFVLLAFAIFAGTASGITAAIDGGAGPNIESIVIIPPTIISVTMTNGE